MTLNSQFPVSRPVLGMNILKPFGKTPHTQPAFSPVKDQVHFSGKDTGLKKLRGLINGKPSEQVNKDAVRKALKNTLDNSEAVDTFLEKAIKNHSATKNNAEVLKYLLNLDYLASEDTGPTSTMKSVFTDGLKYRPKEFLNMVLDHPPSAERLALAKAVFPALPKKQLEEKDEIQNLYWAKLEDIPNQHDKDLATYLRENFELTKTITL